MAIRTISDTGGFYNSTASWQEGTVPTSVDDVVSTSTSGPLTVNVFSAAKSIDLSQYANTLTMNNGITISGSFSLGTGFTISGTFGVVVNSSGSLRSYGLTWSNSLTFAGTNMTYTFIDDWVVNSIDFRGASTTILNGKTITASNGLTQNSGAQISGTTKIILTGGTWSHIGAGRISNSVDLDGNINFGTNIYSGGGTISYITGTIVSTGNTFTLQTGTLNLVNTNSIDFNNFTVTGTSILNGSNFNLLGNLTITSGLSGTSTIIIKGTTSQTWTSTAYLSNNLTINKISGTLSLSANTYYSSGTMSFISGSVSTAGNTLNPVSCVLNTNGINWNNILFGVEAGNTLYTITLGSNLKVLNSFYLPSGNALNIINTGGYTIDASTAVVEIGRNNSAWTSSPWGQIVVRLDFMGVLNCLDLTLAGGNTRAGLFYGTTFSVNRNLTLNSFGNFGSWNGDSIINLIGTGNLTVPIASGGYNTPFLLRINIDTPGTVSFFNTLTLSSTTLTLINGKVVSSGSQQNLTSCVVNTKGVTWSSISLATCNIISDFSATTLSTSGTINSLTSSITATSFTNTGTINNSTYSIVSTTINNSGTINSGGITVNNLTVSGAINGGTTSISGNLSVSNTTTGTSNFNIIGTGSQVWSHSSAGYLSNNLFINKPSGTFSISGNVYYQTGTFSYISGSISITNSTLNIGGSCNLQTNPIQWFNINNAGAATVNLIDNLSFTGTWSASSGLITYTGSGVLLPATSSNINFSGSSIITIPDSLLSTTMSLITLTTTGPTTLRGNISCERLLTLGTTVVNSFSGLTGSITTNGGLSVTGNASGTATIIIRSGTWSATNYLSNNLRFDGNSTVSGNVYYQTGTMSYISGLISTTNSTVNIGNTCRLDTNGINWNNFTFIGGTTTILSNLNLLGTLRTQTATITLNSSSASTHKIYMNSISINASTNGNAELVFNTPTTGTWSHAALQYLTNNLTFAQTGRVNLSTDIYYYGGTISYISGSVSSGTSIVYMPGSTTLDTATMSWNEIRNWNTMNLILNAPINMNLWTINWETFLGGIQIDNDGYRDNLEQVMKFANVTVVGTHSINITNQLTIGTRNWGLLYANQWPSTLNLASDLQVPNLLIWLSGARNPQNNPYVGHNVTINNFSTTITDTFVVKTAPLGDWPGVPALRGTTEIIMKGKTWSASNTTPGRADMRFYYETPITIESENLNIISSNTTIPNTLHFNYKKLKYVSGTVSSQIAFHLSNSILDLQNYKLDNILLSGNTTLLSDLKVGNLTASSISLDTDSIHNTSPLSLTTVSISGTGSVTVEGNLGINAATSGKDITLNGTGSQTWTHGSAVYLSNNLLINKPSGTMSISGNVYYRTGTLSYISGSISTTNSTLNIGGNTNLQTNPIQWFNINNAATSTVNLVNNLSFTGTWSAAAGVISYTGSGILSPTSSSRINFSGTSNVTVPDSVLGLTMSSITLTTSGTTQLRGTISCSELLTLSGGTVINNASGFTGFIRTSGGLLMNGNASGTATIVLVGGTWSASGANYLSNSLNIDGNIRTSANIYYSTGTMSYISGNVDNLTNSSVLTIGGSTGLNTLGINWYDVYFTSAGATINLQSDLSISNIFRINLVSQTFTSNTNSIIKCRHFQHISTSSTGYTLNMSNIPVYTVDFTASGLVGSHLSLNNNTFVSGNLTISGGSGHGAHIWGGTISMVGSGTITTTSAIKSNLIINSTGKINFTDVFYLGSVTIANAGGANLTYLRGNVVAKESVLSMSTLSTYPYILTGMNKINWKAVLVTSGANITMNEFFSGSPETKTKILPSSTGTYSITFTDNFEKIAKHVNPQNLQVKPGQLIIITDSKRSSTNRGIRYINNSPNGISKGANTQLAPAFGSFLVNDTSSTKLNPTRNYELITYTASSNITLTNNGTGNVNMFKTSGNSSLWSDQCYSTTAFSAPCTIEFNKLADTVDNLVSYAMIAWNSDPTTNADYGTLDYASYPFRTDAYHVYNNGVLVLSSGLWSPSNKFYIVYDIDGFIKHYNGSTLLYSVNYGAGRTVYVDSSFYSVGSTSSGFSNVRVIKNSWNGTDYIY